MTKQIFFSIFTNFFLFHTLLGILIELLRVSKNDEL